MKPPKMNLFSAVRVLKMKMYYSMHLIVSQRWNPAAGGLKVGVYSMWEFETAGVHCSVLTQPTAVLAFRPQKGRKRGGASERASSGVRRSRGGSRMSQTWTQRGLRLNKRLRISLHSGSDAKTFSKPRKPSSQRFNGSSVISLFSSNPFIQQVFWEKEIFIGDLYRCWRFLIVI